MTARAIAVLAALSITASPAFGKSKATCAAYMAADAKLFSTPAIRDQSLLERALLIVATRDRLSELSARQRAEKNEMIGALERAMSALRKSPASKMAYETARHARRKAYRGPVVEDQRTMRDLVWKDVRRCKERTGYKNWPSFWYPEGEKP